MTTSREERVRVSAGRAGRSAALRALRFRCRIAWRCGPVGWGCLRPGSSALGRWRRGRRRRPDQVRAKILGPLGWRAWVRVSRSEPLRARDAGREAAGGPAVPSAQILNYGTKIGPRVRNGADAFDAHLLRSLEREPILRIHLRLATRRTRYLNAASGSGGASKGSAMTVCVFSIGSGRKFGIEPGLAVGHNVNVFVKQVNSHTLTAAPQHDSSTSSVSGITRGKRVLPAASKLQLNPRT